MVYWELFIAFLKIGALCFGGGYAMVPFFEKEIAMHAWTTASDYPKMIAIAQVLPGPFAIDSSAYIGFKVAGLLGAVISSLAISLSSYILLVLITKFYIEFKANTYIQLALRGVRPVIIGLLAAAGYIIGIKPILAISNGVVSSTFMFAILFIIAGFLLLKFTKINPLVHIILFAIAGCLVF